ncbi:MAG: HAMP domain-containing sensor histidine kinase [Bacteroidota bacterium]
MKFKINSIKNRILIGFLSVIVGVLLLGGISLYYLHRINAIRGIDKRLKSLETKSLHMIKTDNDFFDLESINENYFLKKESLLLDKREQLWSEIHVLLGQSLQNTSTYSLKSDLTGIKTVLHEYNNSFSELTELIYERGFKDYGLEGQMRSFAHQLERSVFKIQLSEVLSLRRHEKDFFLRNDSAYIDLFNNKIEDLTLRLSSRKDSSIYMLQNYSLAFNALVQIQNKIGLSGNEGLRNKLNNLTTMLDELFLQLSVNAEEQFTNISSRIIFLFSAMLILIVAATVLWSNFISKKLSRPIKKLDQIMREAHENDLKGLIDISLRNPDSEIENLSISFSALMDKTKAQMKEIRNKSKALKEQNKELKKVNKELDSFIYSTAHDLRSPLASLLGLIHLSEREKGLQRKQDYMILMKGSIQKMDTFIKDVVAYSKNKKLEVQQEEFNIAYLLDQTLEEHKYMHRAEEIDKKVSIVGDTIIKSDESRLKIIFNNLVSNAIRYADFEKSQPWITIKIEVQPELLNIVFSDNGIGIEESYVKKIFQMFFRATESSSGSGLGLFILLETVKKLNGTVQVSSEVKVGTSFYLSLPLTPASRKSETTNQIEVFS